MSFLVISDLSKLLVLKSSFIGQRNCFICVLLVWLSFCTYESHLVSIAVLICLEAGLDKILIKQSDALGCLRINSNIKMIFWIREALILVLQRIEEFSCSYISSFDAVLRGSLSISFEAAVFVFSILWLCELFQTIVLLSLALLIISLICVVMTSLLDFEVTN